MTPGQVMVASDVAQLSKLLDTDDDERSRNLGFGPLLPLRESDGPTLFCFHPASGFARQFSVLSRYLSPSWSIMGIQSPRPVGPMQIATTLDEVCEHHLATLLARQPHGPYYLLGYSLGGTLAQGIAARLRARGETVAFLGLLDTGRRKHKTGGEKRRMASIRTYWRKLNANAQRLSPRSREMPPTPYLPPLKAIMRMPSVC